MQPFLPTASVLAAALLAVVSVPVWAANPSDAVGPIEVSYSVFTDVSPALRDISGASLFVSTQKQKQEKPLKVLPNQGNTLN